MGKGQAVTNKFTIAQWIEDYHWMVNTVKELNNGLFIGAKTTQYGIEATLPKASGGTSDPISSEVARRSRHIKRIKEYEYKILEVQKRVEKVKEPREIEVLFWLLEGKSMRWIGNHMALSGTSIKRIKENIINKMIE